MASIYKRGCDKRDKGAAYFIAYFDEHGRRRTAKGCPDKAATQQIANQIESDIALRKRGIIDAATTRLIEQAGRPMSEHVDDFMAHVRTREAGERVARYLQQVRAKLQAFIDFAEIKNIAQVNADKAAAFLDHLKGRNLSPYTVNEYVGVITSFAAWACTTGRLASNPLATLRRVDAKKLQAKRPRRAFAADEIGALLDAASRRPAIELRTIRHGPRKGQLSDKVRPERLDHAAAVGRERVAAYLLALWTGLRRSELRALTWGDIRLDSLPPKIVLRAATTKSKRGDSIALHPQIADKLREMRQADAKPTARVLRSVPGMKTLRADMKLAGIADVTDSGRLDFHAMRKSLATYLAAQGVPLRLAQAHLRHTDPRLTAVTYTDEKLLPVAAVIADLPALPVQPVLQPAALRMTGTAGGDSRQELSAALMQRARRPNVHAGATLCSEGYKTGDDAHSPQVVENSLGCAGMHDGSEQRVMGLEPTTFTLAT